MKQQQMYKTGAAAALAAMSVLLFWAGVFYKQRMLLCDESYAFFRIVNREQLQIQQYRYGSFITQMFPLIAAKLQMPLKPALMLYSIGFNLFYLTIAIIIFRLKEYRLVILMSFYYLLMTSDSFFWTFNEVYAGMAWMFFFYGLLLSKAKKKQSLASAIVITFFLGGLALITHPLVMLPMIYLWGFYFFNTEDRPFSLKRFIQLSLLVALLVVARIIISTKYSGYDSGLIGNVTSFTSDKFSKLLKNQFTHELLKNALYNYWILPLLFIVGFATMIKQKKFLLMGWTLIFCLGYVVIVCFAFEGYLAFYTESELMPGIIFAVTPFVFLTLPGIKKEIAITILIFIFVNRLGHIHKSSYTFTSRYHFINDVLYKMQQKNISKLALIKKDKNADPRLMLEWGLPTETIIASALMGQQPHRQFLIRTADQLWDSLPTHDNRVLMSCFENWRYDNLNPIYFRPDTTAYVVMPLDSFIAPYKQK